MTAAAKLLWRELRDLHGHRRYCWAGQKTLAERLGWSLRSVSRAMLELKTHGLVDVIRQGQGRTAHYFLKSTAAVEKPVENRADAAQIPLDFACLDTPTLACLSSNIPSEPGENQSECTVQEAPAGSATENPSLEYRKAQKRAVEDAVRAAGIEPDKDLIDKLARKAAFYRATGFQVAAAVVRATGRVGHAPSNAPRSAAWVVVCVENEFFAQFGDPRQRRPPTFETRQGHPVSDETVTEKANEAQGARAAGRSAGQTSEAPVRSCGSLASSGLGARGDSATGTKGGMRVGDGAALQHETNPSWLVADRAPPEEFAGAIFRLAREKCLGARRARAG